MSRAKSRPRRGPAGNPIVAGDTGIFGGPQGGAEPGATESGDLEAREYGVPQADIPGGVRHLVNPQTRPRKTADKPERPADYHKEHGVIPQDDGLYVVPPDATEERPPKAAPEPSYADAVPVYIQSAPGRKPRIRVLVSEGPQNIPATTIDPIRIADRDPHRYKFWICNENLPVQPGAAGTQGASTTTVGSVTSPAADAIITSQALAAGTYTVGWTVQLSGTLAAGDANNFVMESNAVQVAQSLNSAAAGTYVQPPVTVVIPAGGATVEIEALAIGTVGAVYSAVMTVTPVPAPAAAGANPAGIRIGDYETAADSRGLLIPGNTLRDFNSQDAVWVTNQSGAVVTISFGYETELETAGPAGSR